MKSAIASESMRAAPPITVAAATFEGISFADWVYVAVFIYTAAQLGYLLWRWWKEYKATP